MGFFIGCASTTVRANSSASCTGLQSLESIEDRSWYHVSLFVSGSEWPKQQSTNTRCCMSSTLGPSQPPKLLQQKLQNNQPAGPRLDNLTLQGLTRRFGKKYPVKTVPRHLECLQAARPKLQYQFFNGAWHLQIMSDHENSSETRQDVSAVPGL